MSYADQFRDPRELFTERKTTSPSSDPLYPWQEKLLRGLKSGVARRITEKHLDTLSDGLEALGFMTADLEAQIDKLEDQISLVIEDAVVPIVQVKFDGTYKPYNYRDPSGTLKVGDRVIVPTGPQYDRAGTSGYAGGDKVATVTGLGRSSGWKGTITKSVKARLKEEPLS